MYATDADFCLVSKEPPGTVAYLDYKRPRDKIQFAEVIQYNEWMKSAPVYIVEGEDPNSGPFVIKRYLGGDWKPEPPKVTLEDEATCQDWDAFWNWERKLREEYKRRKGWNGNLKYDSENKDAA